jgi:formylmethanofuran dehydrogenase subunit E
MDYGIMAATFVNLDTGKAFRIISTEESRDLAEAYAPEIADKNTRQLEAYKRMPDSVLFRVQQVEINVAEEDLPGPTRFKAACSQCGQVVRDRREVSEDGRLLCKPCTDKVYFKEAREITWPDMNWMPKNNEHRTSNIER